MIDIRKAFIETKVYFGITGAALSRASGVSEKHISQFISLKKGSQTEYKSDLTTTYFGLLLQGMEKLEPEASTYFFNKLYGSDLKAGYIDSETLVDSMTKEQMSDFMFAIARRIGSKDKKINKKSREAERILVNY